MTTSGSDPILECRALSCGYHGEPVLRDVSLSIHPGEVAVLLGPNGSGKSTLLKTISRTLPRIAGGVVLSGREADDIGFSDLARIVAFVPQEEHVPFAFTVRQLVVMGRLPYSSGLFDTIEDHEIAEAAMSDADCLSYADRSLLEISGGERQRALIARAIAQRAQLILLDEPNAHLDVTHQGLIVRLLRRLASEGQAVLAAVHDLNLASTLADRAIVIHSGRVVADGVAQDVLASDVMDRAYGVRFHRLKAPDGKLRIFPEIAASASA